MDLAVYKSINEKKQQILSKWQAAAFSCYADHNLLMVGKEKGRFSNPMDYVIEKSTAEILEWLIKVESIADLVTPVKELCKLRAIQELKPSEALKFIFALKQIIREELEDENETNYWTVELCDVNERIDEIGLLAFDIYSDCRAKIYEVKFNEIKRVYGRDAR